MGRIKDRQSRANSLEEPHLQNNQSKIDWRCDSRGRVPALQGQNPKFKPQVHLKKKIKKTLVKGPQHHRSCLDNQAFLAKVSHP
jgi:hypothetical protein